MRRGVAAAVAREHLTTGEIAEALQRHFLGDDGATCAEDRAANIEARKNGGRVFSIYLLSDSPLTGLPQKVWIITEADRSSTCVLFPEEY